MPNVMEEVHLTTIKPRNNVLLLAQEISFAKVLACNDKRLRDRGVRRLKKWFKARSQGSVDFTREDHLRIWKGLFYCMWMSDKPLIQEELAEDISQLIHSFATFNASLLFVEIFFASLSLEWFGIDQLRLDKFMMLVRRFIRQSLELVARIGWPEKQVQQLADVYSKTLATAPMGLSMHIIEVFCEELAKVGRGELSSTTILQFITVFAQFLANLKDGRLISQITCYVFLHLIRQTELGIEHHMKFSAWKEHGFPGGDLDTVQKIEINSEDEDMMEGSEGEEEVEEEEDREVGVDARAGKVDVLLPPLDFDPRDLLTVLRELRNKKETTTKARKTLIQLINKFENLAAGKYPLGLHKVELPSKIDKKKEIAKAAKRLYTEEQNLTKSDSEEDLVMLSKKSARKKKAMKKKMPVWKISEASGCSDKTESKSSSSWEINELGEDTSKLKPSNSKKRKLGKGEQLEECISNKKMKKTNNSFFSISDSKENSFTPQVVSTPRKTNLKNVLKKTTSNSQNISVENSLQIPANIKNKCRTKVEGKKKNKHVEESTNSVSETMEHTESAYIIREEKHGQSPNNTKHNIEGDENKHKHVNKEIGDLQLNTSTTEKNNGWGGEWDEPLQDGEYEIFIPNRKYVEKRKSLGLDYPVSSFVQKSAEKVTPVSRIKGGFRNQSLTPSSNKKVEFNLSANQSQEYKEYKQKVKSSKSHVPFDAAKKPVQGLLKNSTPSPINPFYQKKLKL